MSHLKALIKASENLMAVLDDWSIDEQMHGTRYPKVLEDLETAVSSAKAKSKCKWKPLKGGKKGVYSRECNDKLSKLTKNPFCSYCGGLVEVS